MGCAQKIARAKNVEKKQGRPEFPNGLAMQLYQRMIGFSPQPIPTGGSDIFP
jgi:hypothetical protein